MQVEEDGLDVGYTNISDGCNVCSYWPPGPLASDAVRLKHPIRDRGDGHLCCTNCGGGYGYVKEQTCAS